MAEEQTFFQRGNADGQQAHEKMLNNANYQGNVSQNHNEILSDTCQNGYHQKKKKKNPTTNVDQDVEKREPSYTVGGNVNLFSHCINQYRGFSKY